MSLKTPVFLQKENADKGKPKETFFHAMSEVDMA